MNPRDRPPATAPLYPTDPPRTAPEPPRFATKFLDEFSGKQQTLKSFFAGGRKKSDSVVSSSPTPTAAPADFVAGATTTRPVSESSDTRANDQAAVTVQSAPVDGITMPFGVARAAFESIDAKSGPPDGPHTAGQTASRPRSRSKSTTIDMTTEDDVGSKPRPSPSPKLPSTKSATKKPSKPIVPSQTKLSNFFAQPSAKAKRKTSPSPEVQPSPKRSGSIKTASPEQTDPLVNFAIPSQELEPIPNPDEEALVAQAVAEADQERSEKRAEQNAKAAPKWNELFAKKLPPLCTIHQKPCKDFSASFHLLGKW